MLDAIRALFSFEAPGAGRASPTGHDIHLAVAALLLEVGYADFELQPEELSGIALALGEYFGLSQTESRSLLETAVREHESQHSLYPFVRRINEHFDADGKRRIIEDMWRVAYADARLDKYEEHRIRRIADLLYVPHKDFIRAKLRVQEQIAGKGRGGELP